MTSPDGSLLNPSREEGFRHPILFYGSHVLLLQDEKSPGSREESKRLTGNLSAGSGSSRDDWHLEGGPARKVHPMKLKNPVPAAEIENRETEESTPRVKKLVIELLEERIAPVTPGRTAGWGC
jgi:hypothetical protein